MSWCFKYQRGDQFALPKEKKKDKMLIKKALISSIVAIALLLLGATVTATPHQGGLADSPWPMSFKNFSTLAAVPTAALTYPPLNGAMLRVAALVHLLSAPAGRSIASKGLYALTPDGILKWR